MKTKDLILELQKCDPEAEVVVGGEAIFFIEQLPGYYDGSYQKLIQNNSSNYNIKGLEFTRAGTKVIINTMSVEDIIWNEESAAAARKLEFKFDKSLNNSQVERFKEQVEKTLKEFEEYEKSQG